jgi:hypothetical protein
LPKKMAGLSRRVSPPQPSLLPKSITNPTNQQIPAIPPSTTVEEAEREKNQLSSPFSHSFFCFLSLPSSPLHSRGPQLVRQLNCQPTNPVSVANEK